MNKLLVAVSYEVETLQAVYLLLKKLILVIKFNYFGCGIGGVLIINNR